jgi:hypothetical protein
MSWKPSNMNDADMVGDLEFQVDNSGDWHHFIIMETFDRLVFGGAVNVGFLESGYILKEPHESRDDTLLELTEDMTAYYRDKGHNRIVVNERM